MNTFKYFLLFAVLFTSFGCSITIEKPEEPTEPEPTIEPSLVEPVVDEEPVVDVWPDNEFTSQIPRFTYGINEKVYTNNEEGFIYGAEDVTIEEYNLYKKELRSSGFKKNIKEEKGDIITWTATKDIYEVLLSYVDSGLTITIIKDLQS